MDHLKVRLEQELANLRDIVPRTWWALYQGSLQAGFNEVQSLALLQTWILSQCSAGIRPNSPAPPQADKEE